MKVNISDYPKNNKDRSVEIEISDDDTYTLFSTLSLIILPSLKKYKEDVSKHIDMEYDNLGKALDSMIKAFELIIIDKSFGNKEEQKLISYGLNKFSEYYQKLWW